jgi:hypothetical protein
VQVVEHQDNRRFRGGHFQECNDGVEKCVALGVGVGARRRGQIGHFVDEPGNKRKQGFDAAQSAQPTGADARHQRTQGFREGLIGRTEVLVATAVQHDRALLIGLPGPLAGQARLADTRFAGDQGGARTTAKRGLPRRQKPLELAPAPDERPGTDQNRGQAWTLHRCIACRRLGTLLSGFQSELEDMLWTGEVAQFAQTQVGEDNVVGQ